MSSIPSLNSLIPSEEYSMQYSSVDEAIQHILQAGAGAWLAKVDIADAFKLLPIHPQLWKYYGIQWADKFYFANRLTFGSKSSPWLFEQLAKALHWILIHHGGLSRVVHYLDDFLLIERPSQVPSIPHSLLDIFSRLQVPVATAKTEGPATKVTFLGIILDTIKMEASLPSEKLLRIRSAISRAVQSHFLTRAELQSLLGMLNFASRIMPQGRAFLSRLLCLLPSAPEQDSVVHLDGQAFADLDMWSRFLSDWNGISLFVPQWDSSSPMVFSDAAGSSGFAAIFRSHWLAAGWPLELVADTAALKSSPLLELYPIVAAAQVWGHHWANSSVTFVTDSQTLVDIVNKGRAQSPRIMALLRKLVWLSLLHNFHMRCVHISGEQNRAADALSRANFAVFFQEMPDADQSSTPVPQFSTLILA
ncbi:uncharacterized protein LOC122946539 [Bufo gargarizans]|uniref:uncharacterized protein LOC122946539 n=1 Tax=Bufo gargarizans TaxID=30331 RepID=UPI001CF59452|nr:uncharacterized protein LOC122946539 [Bufo gargarizans]